MPQNPFMPFYCPARPAGRGNREHDYQPGTRAEWESGRRLWRCRLCRQVVEVTEPATVGADGNPLPPF